MTRLLFIILLFILFSSSYAQTQNKSVRNFTTAQYASNGNDVWPNTLKLELSDNEIGLPFYSKHFKMPPHLPDQLVNAKYKNQTIKLWRDEEKKGSSPGNYAYTYSYDSLSRLIFYEYSSCLECSQLPYGYFLKYNSLNQVVAVENSIKSNDSYKIFYDSSGIITQIDQFGTFMLTKRKSVYKLSARVSLTQ